MRNHATGNRRSRPLRTLRRYLGRCLLCVLTGCRGPAMPYTAQPGSWVPPRQFIAARQLAADTAIVTCHRPFATGWSLLTETADHMRALAEGDFGKRFVLPLRGKPAPLAESPEPLDLAALENGLRVLTGQPLYPANVQLYVEGQHALNALEDLLARATRQIDVIMFQWENDQLGQAIAARVAARAGPDLRVRILIDGGGNMYFGEPDSACARRVNQVITALAGHPYIEVVRIRNPFGRYDHRKLVLVDGAVAWTGGRNFSHPAFFEHHDLSFVCEGPLVQQLQQHFEDYWRTQHGPAAGGEKGVNVGHELRPASTLQPPPPARAPAPNTWARLLYSEPSNRQIAQAIYRAVDLARQRIYVQNVYLTDSRLVYKLAQARQRGVDVRVVLTVHSSTEMIDRNNRVVANRLHAAGVRVYLYPSMTHVKAVTVDSCWAYIGTGNLDALSFRHNYELGLSVTGCPLIAQLEERLFVPDLRPEWEMTEPLPVTVIDYLAELVASLCL
ncbi:MAG: hypothetical protein IT429_11525 [Gemmataceae bacterium]|nr:hypothetical protein [Gemmataceae bacterium]